MSESGYVDNIALISALVNNTDLLHSVRAEVDPNIWRSQAQCYVVKLILALYDQNKVAPRKSTLLRAVEQCVNNEEKRDEINGVVLRVYNESPEESRGIFTDELLTIIKRLSRVRAAEAYLELVAEDKFDEADKVIDKARTIGVGSPGYDYFSEENIESRCDPSRSAYDRKGVIPTGFPRYDRILRGGYGYPELHAICGASGHGKSRFVNNIGANVLRAGGKVCVFSMEMSESVVAARTDQILNGFTVEQCKTGEGRSTIHKTAQALRKRGAYLEIKKFPEYATHCDHLEGYILRTGIQFDLVIVDYLDVMINVPSSLKYAKDEWKLESLKFVEARRLSERIGSPIATVLQPKNIPEGEIITIKTARGAYGKIDTLDSFASINGNEDDTGFILAISKCRYNDRGDFISFGVDKETLTVYEVD